MQRKNISTLKAIYKIIVISICKNYAKCVIKKKDHLLYKQETTVHTFVLNALNLFNKKKNNLKTPVSFGTIILTEDDMSQRRMFSKRITTSGRFLKMPTTSQALYFHLNMHADDDGIVEAFQIMRMTGFSEDDLRVLATKEYIRVINEDLVTYIMDWKEHNLIRPDRKIDSIYKDLLLQIIPEIELVKPKPRADTGKISTGRPVDNQWTAQVRLGKDINPATSKAVASDIINNKENNMAWRPKDSEDIEKSIQIDADYIEKEETKKEKQVSSQKKVNTIYAIFTKHGFDVSKLGINRTQRKAAETLYDNEELEQIEKALQFFSKRKNDQFCPDVKTPYDLASKWEKLLAYKQKSE